MNHNSHSLYISHTCPKNFFGAWWSVLVVCWLTLVAFWLYYFYMAQSLSYRNYGVWTMIHTCTHKDGLLPSQTTLRLVSYFYCCHRVVLVLLLLLLHKTNRVYHTWEPPFARVWESAVRRRRRRVRLNENEWMTVDVRPFAWRADEDGIYWCVLVAKSRSSSSSGVQIQVQSGNRDRW